MRRGVLVALVGAAVSALVLPGAFAEGSLGDPSGDAGDAPDVTGVQVVHDESGQILFRVAVSNLTPESVLWLTLDTDRNTATGNDGRDYVLSWTASETLQKTGWYLQRWDGAKWADTSHATLRSEQTPTGVEFSVNRTELGGTRGFALKVIAARLAAGAIRSVDLAPDGTSAWTYELTTAAAPTPGPATTPTVVTPVFASVVVVPPSPIAGQKLVLVLRVNRSDTGAPLTTGRMNCNPSIAGITVRHTESFAAGRATLALVVPKAAKGKTLKVRVEIVSGARSATKLLAYKVR